MHEISQVDLFHGEEIGGAGKHGVGRSFRNGFSMLFCKEPK